MYGVDTFRIMIDSENTSTEAPTIGEYTFDIRLPFTRSDYTKYLLYVDNFNVSLRGLTTDAVHLRLLNLSNYNSYSSQTGGNNNVVAVIYNPNVTAGRTDNLVLNYLQQIPEGDIGISGYPGVYAKGNYYEVDTESTQPPSALYPTFNYYAENN